MFDSIWADVKREFSYGNMVTRLVIINIAVFLFVNLVRLALFLGNGGDIPAIYSQLVHWFCMPSYWLQFLKQPWGIFTSMFLHEDIWHILWNMLYLYWFGRIVGDFIGNHRILPLYLLGGLVGAIFFFISANLLPYGEDGRYALGASGAVMAIVVAAGTIAPDYNMRLILLGDVKLKYIVGVLVFLDLIGIANDVNTGGHFAHLGGAAFGAFFATQLRKGNDLAQSVNNILDAIKALFSADARKQTQRKKPKVAYKNPNAKRKTRNNQQGGRQYRARRTKGNKASDKVTENGLTHQEQLDTILDKIKETGYDSLDAAEKEFLFNASKK